MFDFFPVELGGAVGVVDIAGYFLPNYKIMASKEEEVILILGANRTKVGSGSVSGSGAFSDFFLDVMAALGRKVVVEKLDREGADLELHCEQKEWSSVRKRYIYIAIIF